MGIPLIVAVPRPDGGRDETSLVGIYLQARWCAFHPACHVAGLIGPLPFVQVPRVAALRHGAGYGPDEPLPDCDVLDVVGQRDDGELLG